VLGHHPHVLQGIEDYRGGIILYSLGEFIFDPAAGNVEATIVSQLRRQTLIAEIILNTNGFELNQIPVIITEDNRPKVSIGSTAEEILQRIRNISTPLKEYKINFYTEIAERNFVHNMKVLSFHISRKNWKYLLQKIMRVRIHHLRILSSYLIKAFYDICLRLKRAFFSHQKSEIQ